MKAGTSSLHSYLDQHPQIFLSRIKEPRFFSEVIDESGERLMVDQAYFETRQLRGMPNTFAEYESLFDSVVDEIAVGEASPEYSENMRAAQQLHQYLPHAKLIVCLRNPTDRLYSKFQMASRGEERDFTASFHADKDSAWVRDTAGIKVLSEYYDLFPRSQILALRFDRLVKDRADTLAEIYRYLEVDDQFIASTESVQNQGGYWRSKGLGRLVASVRQNWQFMQRAKAIVPRPLWNLGKSLAARNMRKAEPLAEELRAEITEYFQDDVRKLEELTGLDLSSWQQSPSASHD